MKILISEVALKKMIREEYRAILEDTAVKGSGVAAKIMSKTIPALREAGVEVVGNMNPTELEPLHGLAKTLEEDIGKFSPKGMNVKGWAAASKGADITAHVVNIGVALAIARQTGNPAKGLSYLAKAEGSNWLAGKAIEGIGKGVVSNPAATAMIGPMVALVFMVPAVVYMDLQRMEDPVEMLKSMQKMFYPGVENKPALGWNKLAVPGSKMNPSDLKKNPLYKITQSRLTRNNPVDVDKLVNEGLIKQEVADWVKGIERRTREIGNTLNKISVGSILGSEKTAKLSGADWGEGKDKRRTQLQALTNASQGFYDKVKNTMWDYSENRPSQGTQDDVIKFSNAVDKLVKKIEDLSEVSFEDGHKVVRQKFIDAGWKGASGFKSKHYNDRREGLIGALYKQMDSSGGEKWNRKDTMMKKYWNEIEKKA